MDSRDKDSVTMRSRKRQRWKQAIKRPGNEDLVLEFKDDFIDYHLRYLYNLFWNLWNNETGITYKNIYYYQVATTNDAIDTSISRQERKILFKLNNDAMNYLDSKKEK